MKIKSSTGMVFKRIYDNYIIGSEINLGYDYSTGVKRDDKLEYYEEVIDTNQEEINSGRTQEVMVYRRIHDDFIMGELINLGYDYSTGVKRIDKLEYYELIPFKI